MHTSKLRTPPLSTWSFFLPIPNPLPKTLTLTLKIPMATFTSQQTTNPPPKRPFCHRCSKPSRLCLCSRLKNPPLENSIGITILQHSLEKHHPLNSTRVARLGFKNLQVVPVTDVNFSARFIVCPVDENGLKLDQGWDFERTHLDLDRNRLELDKRLCFGKAHFGSDANGEVWFGELLGMDKEKLDFEHGRLCPRADDGRFCQEKMDLEESLNPLSAHLDSGEDFDRRDDNGVVNGDCGNGYCPNQLKKPKPIKIQSVDQGKMDLDESLDFVPNHLDPRDDKGAIIDDYGNGRCLNHLKNHHNSLRKSRSIKILSEQVGLEAIFDKYQIHCTSTELQIMIERTAKPDISWVLDTPIVRAFTSNGFTIRKLQKKQLPNSEELHEFEEFKIMIPPGVALLFPSGKSAISLDEVDFEVKHLVVLDGTWAKAQRMYHENPWLKLLPHIKLDPRKESLYSEVRHQPKAGCLSTIESIIYTLKGLGNNMEGLDELLDVFALMIGDQRRCKDEKFREKAMS